MSKSQLFQYAILWHPNPDEKKKGKKSKLLVGLSTMLSTDTNSVMLKAAKAIPEEYDECLDQIEIAVRPF